MSFGQYWQKTYLETQSKVYDGEIFENKVNEFQPLTIFAKNLHDGCLGEF